MEMHASNKRMCVMADTAMQIHHLNLATTDSHILQTSWSTSHPFTYINIISHGLQAIPVLDETVYLEIIFPIKNSYIKISTYKTLT
jgi:hypothetical protein